MEYCNDVRYVSRYYAEQKLRELRLKTAETLNMDYILDTLILRQSQ